MASTPRNRMSSPPKPGDPESKFGYGHIAHGFELLQIQKGQVVVYYCGHLAADKFDSPHKYAIASIAQLAMQLHEEGKVELRLRRVKCAKIVRDRPREVACTEYIAIGK